MNNHAVQAHQQPQASSVLGTMNISGFIQDIDPSGFIQVCKIAFAIPKGNPMPKKGDFVSLNAFLAHGDDVFAWEITSMTTIARPSEKAVVVPIATDHRHPISAVPAQQENKQAGLPSADQATTGAASNIPAKTTAPVARSFSRAATPARSQTNTPAPRVWGGATASGAAASQQARSTQSTPAASSNPKPAAATSSRFGSMATPARTPAAQAPQRPAFSVADPGLDDDIPF